MNVQGLPSSPNIDDRHRQSSVGNALLQAWDAMQGGFNRMDAPRPQPQYQSWPQTPPPIGAPSEDWYMQPPPLWRTNRFPASYPGPSGPY